MSERERERERNRERERKRVSERESFDICDSVNPTVN